MSSDFEAWVMVGEIQDDIKRMSAYTPLGPIDFKSKDEELVKLAERLASQFSLLGLGPDGKEIKPAQSTATPAPVVADEVDFTMVATRKELIDAFGKFTDMDMTWFDNLSDTPKLKAARKFAGQGGRRSAEPLFCPYNSISTSIRHQQSKASWQLTELLQVCFPRPVAPS